MDSEGAGKCGTDYKSFVKTHGRKRNESDYGSQNVSEQILLSLENKKRPAALFSGGNLFAAGDAEALVEALNTTTGINNTLLTSEERVAFAAHVEVQVVTHGRVGFDNITARTGCSNFYVIRVNTFFMGNLSVRPRRSSSPNARHHAKLIVKGLMLTTRTKGGESYRI